MTNDYQISDEDVEAAMRYLKFNDPEHANKEDAIAFLQDLQTGYHGLAHHDPERLLKLKRDIDELRAKRQGQSDG